MPIILGYIQWNWIIILVELLRAGSKDSKDDTKGANRIVKFKLFYSKAKQSSCKGEHSIVGFLTESILII